MDYEIRLADLRELEELPEIERRAGQRFRQLEGLADLADDMTSMDQLLAAHGHGLVWVIAPATLTPAPLTPATSRIIGFAFGAVVDGNLHLEELDVLPEFGRRGLGKALVQAVIRAARDAGFPAITLTTFRHVPWNAPFYAKLGFRIVPPRDLSPGLAAEFADEARRGLPIAIRVVMRLDLKILEDGDAEEMP